MANNYASGTFEPFIPADLITDEFKQLAKAVGVSFEPAPSDDSGVYLFNEDYCTSGYINEGKSDEIEVNDEDLYAGLQDIIRRSEGRLTWISHEQAYTCDKMRRGEFGGSAVFITADDIQYHGTSSWLERRIHEAEIGDIGPDTDDMPVAPQPDINKELLEACIQARAALPDAWAAVQCNTPKEVIDLLNRAIARAEKVGTQVEPITTTSRAATILKDLVEMISEVEDIEHEQFGCREECALCAAKNYIAQIPENTYTSTWNYHKHGGHQFFRLIDWEFEVANKDTVLGYQEWVEHKLEFLLDDISLDGVDAIEVAGCTDTDGHVDVVMEGEEVAEFFSVYTHRPNVGVECHCDFNTKDQAISFAIALAARTGIPVYGNCCTLEVG